MKNGILLFVATGLLFMASCKKSDNTSAVTGNGYMRAKVDGTTKNCDLSVMATNTSGVLALAGRWGGAGGGFTLSVYNFSNAAGTYTIGSGNSSQAIYSADATANGSYTASMVAGSGSIVISDYSSAKVKGTFEFTGRNNAGDTKAVTEGEFEIKL